ncbi:transposase [Streptomyces sp. NPDC057966]|uniref:transposase n=1 Tax=Streptomyces sp. NPDC057966 TaxID=3346292 RepID=UPI0036EADE97
MPTLRVPRAIGQPHIRPLVVLADRAYSSRAIREHLSRRNIRAVFPQPAARWPDRQPQAQGPPQRPPAFDSGAYKRRNTVERCINRLKIRRGLATRSEKTAPQATEPQPSEPDFISRAFSSGPLADP